MHNIKLMEERVGRPRRPVMYPPHTLNNKKFQLTTTTKQDNGTGTVLKKKKKKYTIGTQNKKKATKYRQKLIFVLICF